MSERTTSSNWALAIVQALELGGVDCASLFAELGMDYAALSDPDARFPQDGMTRLWQRAVALSGNPAIGLNMARVVRPASFHVVGYALMSSRNLRDGFTRLVRYQRIIGEGADLNFLPQPDGYALTLAIHGDRLPPARQSAEASLAYCLAFCRWMTGKPMRPREIRFQGPAPEDIGPYQQVFQAPLRFNAEHYGLIFERSDLETPLPSANEALAQLHDRFAGSTWRVFPARESPIRRGRCCVACCRRASRGARWSHRRCTCRSAPCSVVCRRRAPATSNCSTTPVVNWPSSTWGRSA